MKEKIKALLVEMGLEAGADKVARFESVFKEELDGRYIPKVKFDSLNEELKEIKENKRTLESEVASLKKFEGTNEELKTKVKTLEEQMKTKEVESQTRMLASRKKAAIKVELIKDKTLDADLALSLIDMEKIEVDDNDKITKGYKEQLAVIKKDKSFLFEAEKPPVTTQQPSWLKGNKPADGDANPQPLTESQKVIQAVLDSKKPSENKVIGPDYYFQDRK